MEFSTKAVELCRLIINSQYEITALTKQLEDQFVTSGFIVPFKTTYHEIKSNALFNKALTQYLAVGLRNTVEESKFGNKIISDFELFHKMKTDREYNAKGWNTTLIETMKKLRAKLKNFVFRTKERILLDFDLEDTPDITQAIKLKREADKAIVEKAHEQLAKVARVGDVPIDMQTTAGDDDDDVVRVSNVVMVAKETEDGNVTNEVTAQAKLLSIVLQTIPELTEGPVLLRYNAEKKAICVSDRNASAESERIINFVM